ncbi:MAG: hypothetical protein ACTSYJ_03580 [Candidatus Thorarchaeota archaeon]
MRKYSISVIVGFVVIIIIGQISVANDMATSDLEGNYDSSLADVTGFNFVPDSNFINEAEIVVNGTSDEFLSSYHQADNESDFNYMELTWEHEANTPLDFKNETDENLPDCNDFIYFYQEFEWTHNERPSDANFTFSYVGILTGDFAESPGNLMFRVYVWLIDSSGNWIRIYESREATYPDVYQNKRVSLNYFDITEVWDGMVSLNGTPQEDPEDSVQIAVGLAPTWRFENYQETEPWTFYDGSVSIRVRNMELLVYGDFVEDPNPSTTTTSTTTTNTTIVPELPIDLIIVGVTGASIAIIAVVVYIKKFK